MSITTGDFRAKITSSTLLDKKQRHEPITCLTAYDYASARLVDEAGIDMVLVGDSLGMVMLGYDNTLHCSTSLPRDFDTARSSR